MLRAEDLTLGYGEKIIVQDVSFNVNKGDILTIIGVNGCGKSTLLKSLCRNIKPMKGNVYLESKSIFKQNTKQLAKKMAVLPQMPKVPDDFTVRDLVTYGRFPHLKWNTRLKKEDYEIVDWAICATRVDYLQHRNVSSLSGGERQRAWIAMALAQQPEILLLDEPTTFLDISYQFEVLELVKRLNKELKLTIVMVLHDLNQAARYSNRILVLKDGRVYKDGNPYDVINRDVLEEVFNINVKVFNDFENNCPYFIPVSSTGESNTADIDEYGTKRWYKSGSTSVLQG